MEFIFEKNDINYEDYSSGRVLYNYGNTTGFPVRLASELFQRGLSLLDSNKKINIYDPFCGGGYLLASVGLIHGNYIGNILASDTDNGILDVCKKKIGIYFIQIELKKE